MYYIHSLIERKPSWTECHPPITNAAETEDVPVNATMQSYFLAARWPRWLGLAPDRAHENIAIVFIKTGQLQLIRRRAILDFFSDGHCMMSKPIHRLYKKMCRYRYYISRYMWPRRKHWNPYMEYNSIHYSCKLCPEAGKRAQFKLPRAGNEWQPWQWIPEPEPKAVGQDSRLLGAKHAAAQG